MEAEKDNKKANLTSAARKDGNAGPSLEQNNHGNKTQEENTKEQEQKQRKNEQEEEEEQKQEQQELGQSFW